MNKKNTRKLFEDFPTFFRGHDAHDPRKTLIVFGFECGDGWFDLIYKLCKDIKAIVDRDARLKNFIVLQVKEKLGGLRFYVGSATREIFRLIHKAERDSYRICELCGKPGCLRSSYGWYRTLCDECVKSSDREWEKADVRFHDDISSLEENEW